MPCAVGLFGRAHQQEFDRTAEILTQLEPRRKDAGVISHQQVAIAQMTREFVETRMRDLAGSPLQHEQPGVVAARERLLGYQRLGQVIAQFTTSHFFCKRAEQVAARARTKISSPVSRDNRGSRFFDSDIIWVVWRAG